VERREEEAAERVEAPLPVPAVTAERVLPPEAERATVEGARVTPEERREEEAPTTEERVEAPLRAEAPLRTLEALVAARETLLREAAELRVKLLWEAAPRAEKLPSRCPRLRAWLRCRRVAPPQ